MIPHFPIGDLIDLKRMETLDHFLKDEKQVLPIFIWKGFYFNIGGNKAVL